MSFIEWEESWEWKDVPEEIKETFFNDNPDAFDSWKQQHADLSMAFSLEGRVANQEDLKVIAGMAKAQKLNRQLPKDFLRRLDPNGNNILMPILLHRTARMEPAPPHMRCEGYFAVKGGDLHNPPRAMIDVPMELFVQLPTVTQAKAQLGLPNNEAGEIDRFIQEYQERYQ